MANRHGLDRALNIDFLNPSFVEAVSKAWSRETCWPGCIGGYPENRDDNPSYGNCFVTALAAWADENFASYVVPGKINEREWHFRLHFGVQIDPTWQQTEEGSVFRALSTATPEERAEYREVVTGSIEDPSLLPRLTLLLDKMEKQSGYSVGYSAGEIIEVLKDEFRFVYEPDFISGPRQNPPTLQF